jgi:amino acid transporter
MASEQSAVFLRKASGVVRGMSSVDGMYYGYLAAAGLYALVLILFLGAATFPKANILAANLISLVLFLAVYLVYANLASAMPRSGGDYVFTSRLVHPSIGFAIGWGAWIFWGFWFVFLAASAIVTGVLSPMFSAIGVATGHHFWIDASNKITEWYVRLPIVVVLILLATWVMIAGMKQFVRVQKLFMMPASIGGLLIILLSYIFVSKGTFFSHFDQFQNDVGGISSAEVVSKAKELGYGAGHSALFDTLGYSVNLTFFYVWTIWSAELLGEIKSAGKIRTSFNMFAGAGALQFATFMIGIYGAYQYFGKDFLQSFSWLALNHPDALGGSWDFRGAATLFYIPSLSIVVGILLFICFLGPISQSLFNPTLSSSRLLLAMSFDRLLPSWFARMNRRGVPHLSIWFCSILSIALAMALELVSSLTKILFWSSFATLLGIFATLAAGLVFPRTGRDIFSVSPGSKWRVLGFPTVQVAALIGLIFIGGSMIVALTHDGFGLLQAGSARVGLIAMIVVVVVPLVAFFGIRQYRRGRGIEIDYAFRAIPPE